LIPISYKRRLSTRFAFNQASRTQRPEKGISKPGWF